MKTDYRKAIPEWTSRFGLQSSFIIRIKPYNAEIVCMGTNHHTCLIVSSSFEYLHVCYRSADIKVFIYFRELKCKNLSRGFRDANDCLMYPDDLTPRSLRHSHYNLSAVSNCVHRDPQLESDDNLLHF